MKKFFNLVEVTLAIAVVGIGIAGVMSLFPVGFQASRDAIGDNYAATAAEQFISLIARKANDPTLDDPVDPGDDPLKDFWDENIVGAIGTSIPDSGGDPLLSTFPLALGGATNAPVLEGNIYPSSDAGVFRIKGGNANVTDFYATIRIWKSQVQDVWIFSQNSPPIPYDYAARLNIEVSWPVEKPYAVREKRYYCTELFRQLN